MAKNKLLLLRLITLMSGNFSS
jgi:hypothetical protein